MLKRLHTSSIYSKIASLGLLTLLLTSSMFAVFLSVSSTVAADTLNYPWPTDTEAPCEFAPNGGSSCTNPNNSSDIYDWGVYISGVFNQYRNGYEYRNCTDYTQWKESTSPINVSVPTGWGNGGQWYDNAPTNEKSTTPKAWDAAVVQGNPGHVAFVESVNGSTITVTEYNHDAQGHGDTRTGNASSMGFTEFVDFGVHPSNTASTRPGGLVRDSSDMDTFYQSGTNLVDRYWNSTTGWASVSWAVNASSAPTAVARDSADMDVLFRNASNNLIDEHWNSSTGWATTTLVSDGSVRGNPQVITRDSADMDVFYRDSANKLADAHWNSSTGWGLTSWADNIKGDPSPTDRSSGNMDVFFRNTSNNLIDRLWISTSGWSFATLVSNGTIGGDPGAVTPDSGHMDAFYKDGSTGNLYDRWWDSVNGWNTSSWSGTPVADAPSAISRDTSDIDVFYRNGSNNLIDQHWNLNTGWGTSTIDSSGIVSTDPSAIDRTSGNMDVFYGYSNGQLVDSYWDSVFGWNATSWGW